jgi:hypothetical protein
MQAVLSAIGLRGIVLLAIVGRVIVLMDIFAGAAILGRPNRSHRVYGFIDTIGC